jgi:hypothetical protein
MGRALDCAQFVPVISHCRVQSIARIRRTKRFMNVVRICNLMARFFIGSVNKYASVTNACLPVMRWLAASGTQRACQGCDLALPIVLETRTKHSSS